MAIVVGLCSSSSHAGANGDGRSVVGPAASTVMTSTGAGIVTETGARQIPSAVLPWDSATALRTIPTVSKQVLVGGMTLVPYIGAGFGGGYATEQDRSLHTAPAGSALSNSVNAGLRNLLGQQLIPNEVQLGIRFPF